MRRHPAVWLSVALGVGGVGAGPAGAWAQIGPPPIPALHAESLRAAGRHWHAAEALLAAAAAAPRPNALFIVEGAKAELRARRYDRARGLLAGQPWLEDYREGEALAVLGEAEARLGEHARAAARFAAARLLARSGPRAALFAVWEGLAREAGGETEAAARAYAAARQLDALASIDPWLRLRLARVTRDTALVAQLLADLPGPAAREAPATRARALLVAGDSGRALAAFAAAGEALDEARLALALGDTARARGALFGLMARAPETDDAAAAVGLALGPLPPRTPVERVALARAMKPRGAPADAVFHAERAARQGDSSAATLLLLGELLTTVGRTRDAERAYRAAARDSGARALALYRRARLLARMGDPGASAALSGFARAFPADTAAPTALYTVGDLLADRGDTTASERWLGELIARYPADPRASLARFRLAARAWRLDRLDSAAALYRSEVEAPGPQRFGARFWLGKLAWRRGDTTEARVLWRALARDDSIGYYGLRARREADLPPVTIAAAQPASSTPAAVTVLARIDTLVLAGLDSEARAEVRQVIARPPQEVGELLAWSEGLAIRGWGSAAVRLGWQAALRAPADPRVLRAIYPWPNRAAVEGEAAEFGVDPLLLVAVVRQESVFDTEALSPAGARGLAQLMPGTASLTARGLDVSFSPELITVPDLNLHLGAAHLADLLERFGGRLEAAVAAYNAGPRPVTRWLIRPGADDPDQFIELIPFQETRGYVRAVLRNRELYRALYAAPND